MGVLKIFSKARPAMQRLPSGSITVDSQGSIVTTTVSSIYPVALLKEICDEVLRMFREAREAQMPLNEFKIQFGSLQITARDARGGAIIFLSPAVPFTTSPAN